MRMYEFLGLERCDYIMLYDGYRATHSLHLLSNSFIQHVSFVNSK